MGSMGFWESFLRPALFRLDPEMVHEWGIELVASGVVRAAPFSNPRLGQTLCGLRFENPLGLAAGFDKNARCVERWGGLGFGFAEVGTATFHPQPGNDPPRLFRLPADRALINRLGFNNQGASSIAARLAEARPELPIGVNLGKSKSAELRNAAKDYRKSFELLKDRADYFVVNVSSPNTPGLRELQERGPLLEILAGLKNADAQRPLFVKVSPDLGTPALDAVVEVAHEAGIAGLVATNTTTSREHLGRDPGLQGGLSGAPLREPSNQVLAHLSRSCDPTMVLIGVGGIFSGDDLFEKISLGAHLCQVYTGWIYGGPGMVPRALRRLCALLNERGIAGPDELRGSALR